MQVVVYDKIYFMTTRKEFVTVLILRTIGNFLILSSLFLIVKTFYQPVTQEIRYFVERKLNKQYIVSKPQDIISPLIVEKQPSRSLLASLLNIQPVEVMTPEDPSFSIVIPKIGANARVLSNIDASDEKMYLTALQNGVAHTLGTAFPDEGGHIFLFAHSTDYFWNVGTYNAVFYLLDKLDVGDEINLFYQNKRIVYNMIGKRIVEPSQVEYLTRKTNKEFLTLQTCWPAGTTLRRLLIFAQRVAD